MELLRRRKIQLQYCHGTERGDADKTDEFMWRNVGPLGPTCPHPHPICVSQDPLPHRLSRTHAKITSFDDKESVNESQNQ